MEHYSSFIHHSYSGFQVDTSRFWFNYRHASNVLSIYRTIKVRLKNPLRSTIRFSLVSLLHSAWEFQTRISSWWFPMTWHVTPGIRSLELWGRISILLFLQASVIIIHHLLFIIHHSSFIRCITMRRRTSTSTENRLKWIIGGMRWLLKHWCESWLRGRLSSNVVFQDTMCTIYIYICIEFLLRSCT